MKHRILTTVLLFSCAFVARAQDAHHDGEDHKEGVVAMAAAERRAKGIETAAARPRELSGLITAPGEVTTDAYRSSQVTPRIAAQVVARHARLGDTAQKDAPLVTLSSVAMAEAQGKLLVADREWQRVRGLGRKVVSAQRFIEAQVARQQAYAQVRAYGMTEPEITALLENGDASRATGRFKLVAPQDGTVIHDRFVVGELVEPGRVLFEITDESQLWVEASLSPEQAGEVSRGAAARVSRNGKDWIDGKVVQFHHQLEKTTRTQRVRIAVDNADDALHPGQYVDVQLSAGDGEAVLAVPEDAVLLLDGGKAVFKVKGDDIVPQPVEAGQTRGGWTEIAAGLAQGEQVVTRGAFLIKSLLLKSQLGEGHAH